MPALLLFSNELKMSFFCYNNNVFQVPLIVQNEDDVITAGSNQMADNIVPIFCVSNVSGDGLQHLTHFLHVVPPGVSLKEKDRLEQVCMFLFSFYSLNFFLFLLILGVCINISVMLSGAL